MKKKNNFSKHRSPKWTWLIGITMLVMMSLSGKAATLNLKLFIQGYYTGSGQMTPARYIQGCTPPNASNVVDEIVIELHDVVNCALAYSYLATLYTDGTCIAVFPSSIIGNTFYVKVKGCNTFSTCTALPVTFGSTSVNYDFSTASSQAFGGVNQVEVDPGVWALISGDMDGDEELTPADEILISSLPFPFKSGCFCTDLDGDGNTGISDLALYYNNAPLTGVTCCP